MTSESWRVVVVRAWRDGAEVRVRILTAGDMDRHWTGAAAAAPEVLRRILAELATEPPAGGATGADTPR
ncbi:MAG TPA: hypothetical protein VI357_09105 [Mycobacteriales bacterium]